jgi:hypothetical protein
MQPAASVESTALHAPRTEGFSMSRLSLRSFALATERQRILLGATAISLLQISPELAAQPAPPGEIQPAPQPASPANETAAPSAAPSTPPATPAETPPGTRNPLPTITVTTKRPKQPVAPTGKPAQAPSRPAAGRRPAPAQAAPAQAPRQRSQRRNRLTRPALPTWRAGRHHRRSWQVR